MSCSDSSSDNPSNQNPEAEEQNPEAEVPTAPSNENKIIVDVGDHVNNIQLTAGEKTEVSFIFNLSPSAGPYDSISVNLQETLNSGAVNIAGLNTSEIIKTLIKSSAASGEVASAQMSVRVGSSDQVDRVCQFGYLYGPFTIKGNESNEPVSINPPTVTAEPATISIINTGTIAICIQIDSPVDATIGVDKLEVERIGCNKEPSDIIGTWTGTYTCENTGEPEDCPPDSFDQPITLTIIKDKDGYHYHDDEEEAFYDGYLCGTTFEFEGGGPGYKESGIFVHDEANKATKTSSWIANDGLCSGECTDKLERENELGSHHINRLK